MLTKIVKKPVIGVKAPAAAPVVAKKAVVAPVKAAAPVVAKKAVVAPAAKPAVAAPVKKSLVPSPKKEAAAPAPVKKSLFKTKAASNAKLEGKDILLHNVKTKIEERLGNSITLKAVDQIVGILGESIIETLVSGTTVRVGKMYFKPTFRKARIFGSPLGNFQTALSEHTVATMKELKISAPLKTYGTITEEGFQPLDADGLAAIGKPEVTDNDENWNIIVDQINGYDGTEAPAEEAAEAEEVPAEETEEAGE